MAFVWAAGAAGSRSIPITSAPSRLRRSRMPLRFRDRDAVAGSDVLGERGQHQTGRRVTATAEGMSRVDHHIMNRPVESGSIQGGRTWKRPPIAGCVVPAAVESGRVGDVLYPPTWRRATDVAVAVSVVPRGSSGRSPPADSTSTPEFVDEKFVVESSSGG